MKHRLPTTAGALVLMLVISWAARAAEKWYVRRVVFEGNRTFRKRTLQARMAHRPSVFLWKTRFSRSVLDDDLSALLTFYRNQGFLDAQVALKEIRFDSTKHRVDIWISIEEGPRTLVSDVAVFGNQAYPDSFYLGLISLKPGEPLVAAKIDQDVRRIMDALAERGFLGAKVSPEVRLNREEALAVVEYTISEGPQIRVAEIRIEGLDGVHPYAVRRELQFKKGQILRLSAIRESIRRLYRTGLFRSVEINPVLGDSTSQRRPVVVRVSELEFGQLEGGVGFGTYEKLRASVEASYGNLFGDGRKIGVSARVSFVRQKAEVAYSDPWAFGLPMRLDVSGYYEHHDERSYEAELRGLLVTFGTQTRRRHIFRMRFREEGVRWIRLLGSPPGDIRAKNTRSLTASYAFDVRDDLFNPTKGTYFHAQMELAGLGGPGTNQFAKVTLDWRGYRPWKAGAYLSAAVRIGAVREYGLSTEVPIQERFFAGGAKTVRGFGERQLGPRTEEGIPLGGRASVVLNFLEVRFPLYKSLGGALFLDAGNVWSRWEEVSLGDLRWVSGFGLRFRTPIGVLRLDLGLKLDRRPGESRGAILVDMGQAF